MITPFLILLIAIFLFGLGGGATIWLFLRWRRLAMSQTPSVAIASREAMVFHWKYTMLPIFIFILSVLFAACFYHQLPDEVAYHFKPDGLPDRWLSREVIIAWMLLPQLILTMLAGAITLGIARVGILPRRANNGVISPAIILSVMGNMIGLPQLVLCFAMLDIFSYNSFRIHLMSLWVFALIVMGMGAIILGFAFISAVRRARRAIL